MAVETPPPPTEETPLPAFVFVWTNGAPVSDETLQQQQQQEIAKIISRVVCSAVSDRSREELLINFTGPATTGLINNDVFKEAVEREDVIVCVWSLFGLGSDPDAVKAFSELIKPGLRLLFWSYHHQPFLEPEALQLTGRFVALPPGNLGYTLEMQGESGMAWDHLEKFLQLVRDGGLRRLGATPYGSGGTSSLLPIN